MVERHHRIVIVGGGTAGITTAARLLRAGETDVAVVEPSTTHYYQPLWTLVGGGLVRAERTARPESRVMPKGVTWLRAAVEAFDPDERRVVLSHGDEVTYDALVVAPGIAYDWDRLPGSAETLGRNGVSTNYEYSLAPRTWDFVRNLRSGSAVFMMPSGPIKCGGAPQKIAYLAADHWRREGVLDRIDVTLVLPSPDIFGVPEFADALHEVVKDYGIDVRYQSEVVAVDGDHREVIVRNLATEGEQAGAEEKLHYDVLHAVPPMSAPAFVRDSPLSTGDALGYVDVDQHTLQHVRHPEVFSLGDAAGSPNSKTGAAVRKQAPVVVANLLDQLAGRPLSRSYDGYSSCPIVTSHDHMLLCEFDYTGRPHPTIPLIDTTTPRRDMYLLKRYGLPFLYWNLMLRGLA